MDMIFCSNCGTELDENQKFCPECGTRNEVAFEEAAPERSKLAEEVESEVKTEAPEQVSEGKKDSEKSILKIDIKEQDVKRAKEKARKGFGSALRIARKGIDRGIEVAEKGIDSAKGTIEERKARKKGPEGAIFCPNCGQKVPADSKFCTSCGEKLE